MGKPDGTDSVGRQGPLGVMVDEGALLPHLWSDFFCFGRNITALHCLTALCEFGMIVP
jgi:hypothetical protein